MSPTINVLFLAAEAVPFVKIGGLADVAGSLPLALRALPEQVKGENRLDVRLVLPLHQSMRAEETTLHLVAEFSVSRGGGYIPAQVYETSVGGMPVYLISGDPFTSASSVHSADPALDREKYTFFSLAVLELSRRLDWQVDILHANDWHTALALYALRCRGSDPAQKPVRTVLTVHNLGYMGGEGSDVLSAYELALLDDDCLPKWAQTQALPLGLWAADVIVPVSPTYAREVLTPELGCGLDTYLRTRTDRLTGVLNGLDINYWNPETDQALAKRFTADDLPARAANKTALQKALELKEDGRVPLLAMIGRIDQQKGLDIAFEALRRMTKRSWQFVILGSGDPILESAACRLQADLPGRARAVIRYDEALGRLIYGGADLFLMPSRYEPCGLAQMIAMRYGCVPLVRATGGLRDTVQEGETGFLFEEAEPGAMLAGLERALAAFARPEKWQQIQRKGMNKDYSWLRPARQYAAIYRSLVTSS